MRRFHVLIFSFLAFSLSVMTISVMTRPAHAITINLIYDPEGEDAVDPCAVKFIIEDGVLKAVPQYAACQGPDNTFDNHTPELTQIIEAAAAHWEDIIEDDHAVEIRYWWLSPEKGAPDANVLERDGDGRPTKSRMRISVDLNYFYDSTPEMDEEFDMRPKLFRTTKPVEQTEAFFCDTPPEVLEVGFNGREPQDTDTFDLLTVTLHEMAHALGLAGVDAGICDEDLDLTTENESAICEQDDGPFYHIDPGLVGGSAFSIRAGLRTSGFDCPHLDMGGIVACKPAGEEDTPIENIYDLDSTINGFKVDECGSHQALMWFGPLNQFRARPTATDILALQLAGNWQDIDLPRKYSLASGSWTDPVMWLGNRVPDGGDDVYIVNQLPLFEVTEISVLANGVASNVYVSDENLLQIVGARLDVAELVTVAGPNTMTGPLRPALGPSGGDPPIGTEGPFTTLLVGTNGLLKAIDVTVEDGARFEIITNGFAEIATLKNDGVISGYGTIKIASTLENTRIISADGGTLTIFTPDLDLTTEIPILDLDGPSFCGDPLASIMAIDGDLVFDGIVADPVSAAVTVGDGRSMTFVDGWRQAEKACFPVIAQHRLRLNGGSTEAVIHGFSTLGWKIEVNGIGRFTSPVVFESTALLEIGIGGLEPGLEHDQLRVNQNAQLSGGLALSFTNGFKPGFTDSFVIMTYASRVGEFGTFTISNLEGVSEGGLTLMLVYEATELRLDVGLAGGTPGDANCNGQVISDQANIHGGIEEAAEFHGFNSVKEFKKAIKKFCEG